jgi:acetyl esterase/lipase
VPRRTPWTIALTVVGVIVLFVSGLVAATPASAARRAALVQDLTYGADPYQYVRVGRPAGSTSARRPTVIFIHGGGWVSGGMKQWRGESRFWLSKGWLTVNAQYRLGSPTEPNSYTRGQEMLQDVQAVLAMVWSWPDVDRRRILLVGDSAGGHLAAWLAGRYPNAVSGLMLWSPVASPFQAQRTAAVHAADAECSTVCAKQRGLARRAVDLFGYSARTTNPLTYLGAPGRRLPPTWVAGSQDEWLPFADNGASLCGAVGAGCTENVAPGIDHGVTLRESRPDLLAASRRWAGTWAGLR